METTNIQGLFFSGSLQDNYIGHQIKEIYYDKLYVPFIGGKKDLTILDIGASGITPYYFAQHAKRVIAVEPAKEHIACLQETIRYNKLENITLVPKAIFLENIKLPLYHSGNKTSFSLHQAVSNPDMPPETVETITMDKLFEDYQIDHVDLMKIDVEGTENEIIASEGFVKVASKIDLIIGETHAWSGRHPNQMRDALTSLGFTFDAVPSDATIFVGRRK